MAPEVQVSKFGAENDAKKKEPTKQERMRELREATKTRFEEMRLKARNAVKSMSSSSVSSVGPMGPIKSFGELQDSIMKMRENFDFIMLGKVAAFPSGRAQCMSEVDDSCC